jgi:hypothetical protein
MLQVLAARDPAAPPMRLTGWIPETFRPPQIHIVQERPADAIMMVRPLGALSPALDGGEVVYWNLDVF